MYDYFDLLERTNILQIIRNAGKTETGLKKAKVFFQSPNYYYCIAENFWKNSADNGNIRESFFASQISQLFSIKSSDSADFTITLKKKILEIEIGGRSKSKKQIEGISDAYILKDGIEVGADNVIPLYLAGMFY